MSIIEQEAAIRRTFAIISHPDLERTDNQSHQKTVTLLKS